MARRWTIQEEQRYHDELYQLYIRENKTISEVGIELGLAESSVFQRLGRLGIPSSPKTKARYCNASTKIQIPTTYSPPLAEFFGIMLGDGHVSHFQTMVTLGTKELEYVEYVADIMSELFGIRGTIGIRKNGFRDVYLGSVALTKWLRAQGLVSNKVASQVDIPKWIFGQPAYMESCLRGFFDTDGSIYRLRFGRQISLTNHSAPLLRSLQHLLIRLGYTPSAVSAARVYITRKEDVERFFREIRPANKKHVRRFEHISST